MITKTLSTILIAVFAVLCSTSTPIQAREKISNLKLTKQLDKPYKDWLDHTSYIITPTEKNVFFKLTNNRERDSFIEMFWNLRDPSKGTPENEYKDEHMKRWYHANRIFKYGSPLPGWKTDRGRIWILLGEPVTRNEILNANGLYPVEIWEYYGGVHVGLPPMFRVVFYKRSGGGDYRLYIPSADGPGALLRSEIGSVDPHDYFTIYNRIKEIEPAVAEIALTLIPGESTINYSPSLQAPLLMAKIYDLPKKRINTSYARNFMNYKGIVDTRVITDYVNLSTDIYVLRDPLLKMNFVHLALRPEQISVDYIEETDQYYFNLDLMVYLKKDDDTVLEYTKKFPFYYKKSELDSKISNGIIVTDYFPVINGNFKLIAILQNSLNKEISYYETQLNTIKYALTPTAPQLYGPLLSYQVTTAQRPVYSAFSVLDTNVKIDPKKSFGQQDQIFPMISVDRGNYAKPIKVTLTVKSLDENKKYEKTYSLSFDQNDRFKTFTPQLEKMPYGTYEITAQLTDQQNNPLVTRRNQFEISPQSIVPHPPLAAKNLRRENNFLFNMMIAQQYQNTKDITNAELNFQLAFSMNKTFPQLLKAYAALLHQTKNYPKLMEVIQNLEKQPKQLFDFYSLQGRAQYETGKYEQAVDTLLKANKIFDSDVSVLNILGLSLIRIGNIEEAEKALSASLKINDQQPDIIGVLNQIKAKKKEKTPEKKRKK